MKLTDLIKNVSGMTDDELRQHVENIRHNKYVAKPAVKKRVQDEEKKERNTTTRSANKLIENMTDEQKAELLKKLMEG